MNASIPVSGAFEAAGFQGLLASIAVCVAASAALLLYVGRQATGRMFRKEAMAVVGLSWVMATVLGRAAVLPQRLRPGAVHPP